MPERELAIRLKVTSDEVRRDLSDVNSKTRKSRENIVRLQSQMQDLQKLQARMYTSMRSLGVRVSVMMGMGYLSETFGMDTSVAGRMTSMTAQGFASGGVVGGIAGLLTSTANELVRKVQEHYQEIKEIKKLIEDTKIKWENTLQKIEQKEKERERAVSEALKEVERRVNKEVFEIDYRSGQYVNS